MREITCEFGPSAKWRYRSAWRFRQDYWPFDSEVKEPYRKRNGRPEGGQLLVYIFAIFLRRQRYPAPRPSHLPQRYGRIP
jgi:hypothetical protein